MFVKKNQGAWRNITTTDHTDLHRYFEKNFKNTFPAVGTIVLDVEPTCFLVSELPDKPESPPSILRKQQRQKQKHEKQPNLVER